MTEETTTTTGAPKPALKPSPVARGAVLSPKKAFDHFGLLDHSLGSTDPGFWTKDGVKTDPSLQARLEAMLAAHRDWAGLRVAIADLSGGAPKFAGNLAASGKGLPGEAVSTLPRCLETWETASTSKIAVLYGAYQLRREVIEVAKANPTLSKDGLRDKLMLQWLKSQVIDTAAKAELLRDKAPKVELRDREVLVDGRNLALRSTGGVALGAPDLDTMFDLTKIGGVWSVRFKGEPEDWDTDPLVLGDLQDEVRPAGVDFASPLPAKTAVSGRAFTFFDKLWLMIDASHNEATDACLDAVGYLYIDSLLWRSGLFDPRRGGGMWVGRHYAGSHRNLAWSAPPGPRLKTRDGDLIKAGMSAASGVAYMTLLHQGKLVDAASSKQMMIFLDRARTAPKGDSIDGSPAVGGIVREDAGAQIVRYGALASKIGLGNFQNYFDAAIVKAKNTKTGKRSLYAVSFMDYAGGKSWAKVPAIATALYDVIDPP